MNKINIGDKVRWVDSSLIYEIINISPLDETICYQWELCNGMNDKVWCHSVTMLEEFIDRGEVVIVSRNNNLLSPVKIVPKFFL